jgi:hypothetical protein
MAGDMQAAGSRQMRMILLSMKQGWVLIFTLAIIFTFTFILSFFFSKRTKDARIQKVDS